MYGCFFRSKGIREIIFFHFSSRGKTDSVRYPIEIAFHQRGDRGGRNEIAY